MTAAEHAATVREAIVGIARDHALASLVWLEEQAARAEAQFAADNDRIHLHNAVDAFDIQCRRLDAIEKIVNETGYASDRIDRINRILIEDTERFEKPPIFVRTEAAEVRVAQLETALQAYAAEEPCPDCDGTRTVLEDGYNVDCGWCDRTGFISTQEAWDAGVRARAVLAADRETEA